MSRSPIEILAERYSQLYVDPDSDGAEEACRRIVRRGEAPGKSGLAHFSGDGRDSFSVMETPAGPVEVLTLFTRKDFETFLRIMMYHCRFVRIPETQGAATLIGIINWQKIRTSVPTSWAGRITSRCS